MEFIVEGAGFFLVKEAGIMVAGCHLPSELDQAASQWGSKTHAAHAFLLEKVASFFEEGRTLLDGNTVFLSRPKAAHDFRHPRFLPKGLGGDLIPSMSMQKTAMQAPLNKDEELELWKDYFNNGSKKALNTLTRSFQPLVYSRTKAWTQNSPLPKPAVEAEGMRLLRQAFDTYDPNKGAALNTHVWNRLHKIHRYGYTYQNVGSIPEPRAAKVGQYQNAFEILKDRLGREPTLQELKQDLGWKLSDLRAIQEELRSDLEMDDSISALTLQHQDNAHEAMMYAYYEADPMKKLVMEHTLDAFQEKPTIHDPSALAKVLGIKPAEVRSIRRSAAEDIRSLLEVL